jgi:hypothetical protein
MIDTEVVALNNRMLADILFPATIKVLNKLGDILTKLKNDTLYERTTVRKEITKRGKEINHIETRPLTKEEINAAITSHHLNQVISYIKDGLSQLNKESVSYNEISEILESCRTETFYFEQCEKDGVCDDYGLQIINIKHAMNFVLEYGYQNPEKINNIFYFLANKSLHLFELMGV